jgi:hypothetical protein
MPTEEQTKKPSCLTQSTTLREASINTLKRILKQEGTAEAMKAFETMNKLYSRESDWPAIAQEIDAMMEAEMERKRQKEEQHQQQVEAEWINAVHQGVIISQANLLTGSMSQAPYYSSSTNGGQKHE